MAEVLISCLSQDINRQFHQVQSHQVTLDIDKFLLNTGTCQWLQQEHLIIYSC